MSEYKLSLETRTLTGKKLASVRAAGLIPSVVFGGKEPVLTASDYNATEKLIRSAGYHSPVDLDIAGKKELGLIKSVSVDPVSRKIVNVEFQAIKADAVVEATTPITIINFEASEASRIHLTLSQVMEEIDVKAKPSDLPKEIIIDASGLATLDDKITVKDIKLGVGVELADKEMSDDQVIASLYDAAAEAAAREAADKKAAEEAAAGAGPSAADVPADNGSKPEESAEAKSEEK